MLFCLQGQPSVSQLWPHTLPISFNILHASSKRFCPETRSYSHRIPIKHWTPDFPLTPLSKSELLKTTQLCQSLQIFHPNPCILFLGLHVWICPVRFHPHMKFQKDHWITYLTTKWSSDHIIVSHRSSITVTPHSSAVLVHLLLNPSQLTLIRVLAWAGTILIIDHP